MATIQEYCEKLSTSQLKALLREEAEGRGNLTDDAILLICDILSRRDPSLPSLGQKLQELCRIYSQ